MALKKYKPMTAGTRWRIGNAYAELTTDTPEKTLLEKVKSTAGRNVQGRRAMRYRGGGHKKMYRIIDFKRSKKNIPASVFSIEYDPNRTAFIALLHYVDGEKKYILAPQGLQVGGKVLSGDNAAPEVGNALQLKNIPLGTNVHNIEMQPGQGGKLVRSAGTSAQLTNKEEKYAVLKMPSGEFSKMSLNFSCSRSIWAVRNITVSSKPAILFFDSWSKCHFRERLFANWRTSMLSKGFLRITRRSERPNFLSISSQEQSE